jgi:arylsulfatase A-like enzyme
MIAGNNPEHLGGDVWLADVAMAMMEKEDWSGMVVSFGAIDKAGHMWGAYADVEGKPGTPDAKTHVPTIIREADEQFGRVLAKLKDLGQLDETLIVITTDHGATYGRTWYGRNKAGASGDNWLYGETVNSGKFDKPIDVLQPMIASGNLQFSYQSSMMEAWLKNNSTDKKKEMAKIMSTVPGVVTTYWRDGDHFVLEVPPGKGAATYSERGMVWWKQHAQELADTMACDNGPDVIALVAEETLYGGAIGDHGGPNENDQHIPMIIWSKNIRTEVPDYGLRHVDILPTVIKAMQIPQTKPGDGKAYPLEFKK